MSGEHLHSDGRRTVGLFLPFQTAGLEVRAVTFQPCTFGHLLRWQNGQIMGAMALLAELTGLSMAAIESLRQPDDARVMRAFQDHVHPEIAEDIRAGVARLSEAPPDAGPRDEPSPLTTPLTSDDPPDWGASPASLAPDPLGGYDGQEFETLPTGRPIDHVPGLDP